MTIIKTLLEAKANPGKIGARPVGERRWVIVYVAGGWNNFAKRSFFGRGRSRKLCAVNMGIAIQPNEVLAEWETMEIDK